MEYIKQALNLPDGMILMSGPTGSGKSTTLVAMIKELFRSRYNIISLKIGWTRRCRWSRMSIWRRSAPVRSTSGPGMRFDPDILLVGEIRDKDTAELAIEAALTGHQVLSTIHTTWPAQIVVRLVQLGVPKFYVAETLKAACGQRLAKKLCKSCKEPMVLTDAMVDELGFLRCVLGPDHLPRGSGMCVLQPDWIFRTAGHHRGPADH